MFEYIQTYFSFNYEAWFGVFVLLPNQTTCSSRIKLVTQIKQLVVFTYALHFTCSLVTLINPSVSLPFSKTLASSIVSKTKINNSISFFAVSLPLPLSHTHLCRHIKERIKNFRGILIIKKYSLGAPPCKYHKFTHGGGHDARDGRG